MHEILVKNVTEANEVTQKRSSTTLTSSTNK